MPRQVKIQQTVIDLPQIKTYIDVVDGKGEPVANLSRQDFTALIADQRLPFTSIEPLNGSGQGITLTVLMDISKSIRKPQFEEVRSAVHFFINKLRSVDMMALVSFGDSVKVVQGFTNNKQDLGRSLDDLQPSDQNTALYGALVQALRLTYSNTNLPTRHAILLLTDGENDDETNEFDEASVNKFIDEYRVPIFAIGVKPTRASHEMIDFLPIIAGFAWNSGGMYKPLGRQPIEKMFDQIYTVITRVFVGELTCPRCPQDGRNYGFRVLVGKDQSEIIQVPLFSPKKSNIDPPKEKTKRNWLQVLWPYAIGLLGALLVFVVLKLRSRRPRSHSPLLQLVELRTGAQYEAALDPRILVGRGPECEIRILGDNHIGEKHCEFFLDQSTALTYLRNLGDGLSTVHKGSAVTNEPRRIMNGDPLKIGLSEFHVVIRD